MNVVQTRLDLQELGYIDSYELSGSEGELNHHFPPLSDDTEAVALAIVEGASSERLRLTLDNEPMPGSRYSTRRGGRAEAVVVGLHEPGTVASFAFGGGTPVLLHFAVFRRVREALGEVVSRAVERFRDQCWACKRLVRFVVSLVLTGGGDDVGEDAADFLWEMLPDEMTNAIAESVVGEMLGKIIQRLRDNLPGRIIADRVCRELGFCP